jgi:predicted nucleic acid-binding Zn ribbon protein
MKRCSRCGTPAAPDESFCTECGHRLDSGWRKPTVIGLSIALAVAGAVLGVFLFLGSAGHVVSPPGTSSGGRNRGFKESGEADFVIGYPATLRVEPPLPNERMVFLAQRSARGGGVGETLVVRRAEHGDTPLSTDVEMLNALQSFEHPGRHLLVKRPVSVRGAAGAYELYADFPDAELGGVELRQLDLLVRTAAQRSYHVLMVGPPNVMTEPMVNAVINEFRILS